MPGVQLLAHRGLSGPHVPENTVRAVLAAVDAGADGVEVDLRVTADGIVVLAHDADLIRLAGSPLGVERTSWPVLRDAAAAGGAALARLTDALPALAACRRVVLEVKAPGPAGSPAGPACVARAARVVAGELAILLPSLGATRVTVSSFSEDLLGRVRAEIPAAVAPRFGLLAEGVEPLELLQRAAVAGWEEIHPRFSDLRRQPVAPDRRARGPEVVTWTVDRTADLRWCETQSTSAVIAEGPALTWRAPAAARSAVGRASAPTAAGHRAGHSESRCRAVSGR